MFDQGPLEHSPLAHGPLPRSQDNPIVLKSGANASVAFAVLALFFAFALARGFAGAATTAGRIGVTIFMGLCVVACAWAAIVLITHRSTLTVSAGAITYAKANSARTRAAGGEMLVLDRASGDKLTVIRTTRNGRLAGTGLTIKGSGIILPLTPFGARRVRAACIARGWQFAA
jgi:hypothetical protein